MTINFRCPSCGKVLKVKEGLAGRKAPCPSCKTVLTIPAAAAPPGGDGASTAPAKSTAPPARAAAKTAPPPPAKTPTATGVKPPPGNGTPAPPANGQPPAEIADAETFAASLLGDEPKVEEPVETKTITFNCPQCDDPMTVSVELAGKRAPCPSCRRIVKVPELKKKEPLDWRQQNKKFPSGDKRNFDQGEDAGASTTTDVSPEALLEAGAIPELKEKVSRVKLLTRVGLVVGVLVVVGLGAWWAVAFISSKRQHTAVDEAVSVVEPWSKPGSRPPVRREALAEVYRGEGEWYLRSERRDGYAKALKAFTEARSLLGGGGRANTDADMMLTELAFAQLQLIGHPDEPPPDPNDKSQKNSPKRKVRDTLSAIGSPEVKAFAGREVCRRLVERGHAEEARGMMLDLPATSDEWKVEAHGLAGLEQLAGKDNAWAEKLAKRGLERVAPVAGAKRGQQVTPSLVALCVAMKNPDLLQALPEAKGAPQKWRDTSLQQGYVVGLAVQGDGEALKSLKSFTGPTKAQGLLDAGAALPPDQGKPFVEAAMDVAENELKGRIPSWTLTRMVFYAVRCGLLDRAGKIAATINDPGLRGWAQLQVLRATLDASPAKADDAKADDVEKQSLSWYLARVAIARHNAKHGHPNGSREAVRAWEEPLRPFGLIGHALGMQDRE